ncbi:alpha/beta fold hydrolase [Streptomyces sp. Edi2]|uniref:thioesterase domain-containing protein n=1 Tax=Streptomyces sp. Edi2 TaxID=3162528 RepID=UPI003305FF69
MADEYSGTLVPLRPSGSLPPLYCVHPVSGSAYAYVDLARELGSEQPVYGFEAPGFDGGAPLAGSIEELAATHVKSLIASNLKGPYCLLGWSLGGTVAFEVARKLILLGEEVPVLVIVDAEVPNPEPLPSEKVLLHKFLEDLIGASRGVSSDVDSVLAGLGEEPSPEMVFSAVEQADLFPDEIDAEFLLDRYTVFRAHVVALFDHRVEGIGYPGLITLIRASESVAEQGCPGTAADPRTPGETLCWQDWGKAVAEHIVMGNHHSIWVGDALVTLTDIVRRTLAQAHSAHACDGGAV